jgi:hypothetical protein
MHYQAGQAGIGLQAHHHVVRLGTEDPPRGARGTRFVRRIRRLTPQPCRCQLRDTYRSQLPRW